GVYSAGDRHSIDGRRRPLPALGLTGTETITMPAQLTSRHPASARDWGSRGFRAGAARTLLLATFLVHAATRDSRAEDVFASAAAWIGPSQTPSVALGDIDGDGSLDLVGNSTLYLNRGGRFADLPAWTGPPEYTASVALGDIDGDGRLDLVRGNARIGTTLYLNIGGTFASAPSWTGPSEWVTSVALGDIDGDGDLDLVLATEYAGARLYLNSGGTFGSSRAWGGQGEFTASVALGDADGDGDLDLVC